MAKKYLITYRRHNGSIDFWGNGADIYYLFFVIHELGRLIYELEYQKSLSDDVLITLRHLNYDQAITEIQKILRYLSQNPSPEIELLALVEVKSPDQVEVTVQLEDYDLKHTPTQLIQDLFLFQFFAHLNLLRGYDFSNLNELDEKSSTNFIN